MYCTIEVVKTRISSLEHTRHFIGIMMGLVAGVCILATGNDSVMIWLQSELAHDRQVIAVVIAVSLALAELSFLFAVFSLTDAIHNYSKILEYQNQTLYGGEASTKGLKSHVSALAADDVSYFFVRMGTLFLIWCFFSVAARLVLVRQNCLYQGCVIFVLFVLAIVLVLFLYRVSHFENKQVRWTCSLKKFFTLGRYKKAAQKSRGWN